MNRRELGATALLLLPEHARAHHPWRPYEGAPPLYLEGNVNTLLWNDPHPHLRLVHRPAARLPTDLRERAVLPHRDPRRTSELLERAVVPLFERAWRVELPTLAKLLDWGVQRPKIGDTVGVIGSPGPDVEGTATVHALILFVDGRGYPLASERV